MPAATDRRLNLDARVTAADRDLVAIAALMADRGISQSVLAARVGISQPTLSRILSGRRPTTELERRILLIASSTPEADFARFARAIGLRVDRRGTLSVAPEISLNGRSAH